MVPAIAFRVLRVVNRCCFRMLFCERVVCVCALFCARLIVCPISSEPRGICVFAVAQLFVCHACALSRCHKILNKICLFGEDDPSEILPELKTSCKRAWRAHTRVPDEARQDMIGEVAR